MNFVKGNKNLIVFEFFIKWKSNYHYICSIESTTFVTTNNHKKTILY